MIHKTHSHTQRYLEILRVFSRYGFYDLIAKSGFDLLGPLAKKINLKRPEDSISLLSRWERIRLALEELGPTYIKFGQVLSTRGDLVPADLFALGRTLILLQGDCEILDPKFNIANQVAPYFKKLVKKRFRPKQYAREMAVATEEMLQLAREIPYEIRELMEKAREGKLKINMEHQGLTHFLGTQERIFNRITMAIILAAITLGSSILVLAKVPPMWNDIPVIGLIGFLAASVLESWLLISILRGGRM